MAVTPILQSINAFDVTAINYTEDTNNYCAILSFTMSGDLSFVRSNDLTIYNANNGSLVTTITTNTTELICKIPTNQNGLINGNQYYATVTVYDQIGGGSGTGNNLGVSSAKQFWCLPSPTLEFTAPAADIPDYNYSNYNFIAQFTMYESGSPLITQIPNKIQSYQFDLYKGSAEGATLINSSGVIFNSGATIDDNVFTINYMFGGLESASTYYAKLTITTEQGMVVIGNSNEITIVTESLTFAVAKVTNKPCDGYIEVQSNITNITGYTNADYTEGSGYIDLTEQGDYVVWGYDPTDGSPDESITFPYSEEDGIPQSKWSFFFACKDLNPSTSNPYVEGDVSYILRLSNYDRTNGGYLYYRDDETYVWLEFYAFNNNSVNSINTYVLSNKLSKSGITSSTPLYVMLRCNDGWYDVVLSTTLG